LQARGKHLASVAEDIDPSGPFGSFVLNVMLSVATLQRDNIVDGWKVSKSRAVERGAVISPTPFGYRRRPKTDTERKGTLERDPAQRQVVADAFRVCARDGLHAAIDLLTERAPERTWTTSTVRRFLGQRVYLGESRYGDLVQSRAHEPLVTRAVFEAAQRQLGDGERRRPAGDFPLSGLAQCGSCGAPLIGGRGGADGRRMYRCSARATCPAPVATSAEPVEQHVVQVLRDRYRERGFQVGSQAVDLGPLEAALQEAEAELDGFASDLDARRLLGPDRWGRHLQERVDAVDVARRALHDAIGASWDGAVVVPDELFDDLDPGELGGVLAACLAAVRVDRGRGPVASRVLVFPKDGDRPSVAPLQDAPERVGERVVSSVG
jgi:site-specific DNA recombinase